METTLDCMLPDDQLWFTILCVLISDMVEVLEVTKSIGGVFFHVVPFMRELFMILTGSNRVFSFKVVLTSTFQTNADAIALYTYNTSVYRFPTGTL